MFQPYPKKNPTLWEHSFSQLHGHWIFNQVFGQTSRASELRTSQEPFGKLGPWQ